MRRAASMADVIATLFIIGIFVLIFTIGKRDPSKDITQGEEVQVKETGVRGRVMSDDNARIVKLRIDNGPGVVPRYSEVSFDKDEVTKLAEKKP
jgi:hypothetical protein